MELFLLFLFLFFSMKTCKQGRPTAPNRTGGSTLNIPKGTPTATPTRTSATMQGRGQKYCQRDNRRSSLRLANARRGEGRGERDDRYRSLAPPSRGSRRDPLRLKTRRGPRRGLWRGSRRASNNTVFLFLRAKYLLCN